MSTIYFTQAMWEERTMDHAVGETRQTPVRCPGGAACAGREDKVVDLAAWKAENLVEPEEQESGLASYGGRELVRRRRRRHNSALLKGELVATLSVAGVMLAMIVRVLVF